MAVDIPAQIAHKILAHFAANARDLPWRNQPGQDLPFDDPNWPYRVWLSEIMLQQTTVAAVTPYFARFTERWPSVEALASAPDEDVMTAWAGLGYYARARNLLACARAVAASGGHFPQDLAGLRALPGIGEYTAAAIAAFAFGKRAVVVDGNIERVVARLYALETPMPKARAALYALTDALTPTDNAGDFAQGLMDLGRSLCTPRNPRCMLCPVVDHCAGKTSPEAYPVKLAKAARPERVGTAWWIEQDGKVLLIRRAAKGLLGGMRALPSSEWVALAEAARREDFDDAPFPGDWNDAGSVSHIFTHFALTLNIRALRLKRGCKPQVDGEWWDIKHINDAGLPSLFVKAARRAMSWENEA